MGDLHRMSNSAIPLSRDAAERITDWLRDTERNCALIANALTARFDLQDGDPDREVDRIEDDPFPASVFAQLDLGPGCPIADCAEFERSELTDQRQVKFDAGLWADCEDDDPAENDDPAGGNIIDEPHDPDGDSDTHEPIRGGGSGDYPGGAC